MLIKRNLLLFFRDKANVFFSLLAVLILIGLYALFLGDIMVKSIENALGGPNELAGAAVSGIVLSGMVAVTSVTSCMGALGVSISDKERAAKDFLTSPVSRGKISLGYMLGAGIVGLTMTGVAWVLCQAYIVSQGGALPSAANCWKTLLAVVLSVLCANSMVYFVSLFINSQNAFAALSTVLGTLIGFLMGVYIPIGQFAVPVQWVMKCFPLSHAASMLRQTMADETITALFAGAPPQSLESFRQTFGVVFAYGDTVCTFWMSAAVLLGTTVLFGALSVLVLKNRKVR